MFDRGVPRVRVATTFYPERLPANCKWPSCKAGSFLVSLLKYNCHFQFSEGYLCTRAEMYCCSRVVRGWIDMRINAPTFLLLLPCQDLKLQSSEGTDDVATLRPSAPPRRGERGSMLKKQASQSVKNLLDTVTTPDMR